jgi:hypothetical protein
MTHQDWNEMDNLHLNLNPTLELKMQGMRKGKERNH